MEINIRRYVKTVSPKKYMQESVIFQIKYYTKFPSNSRGGKKRTNKTVFSHLPLGFTSCEKIAVLLKSLVFSLASLISSVVIAVE